MNEAKLNRARFNVCVFTTETGERFEMRDHLMHVNVMVVCSANGCACDGASECNILYRCVCEPFSFYFGLSPAAAAAIAAATAVAIVVAVSTTSPLCSL